MYWRSLIFSLLLIHLGTINAQNVQLSEAAEISVMTLGPYQGEIYSAFGHSAIHLNDTAKRIDWVYNYGVFDFDQENFFVNFARGKMLYQLGMSNYNSFKRHYQRENRYIIEQRLNLTQQEKQQLVDFLAENYKPENREYYYNYVYDNCATKIRDVLLTNFPGRVVLDTSFVDQGKTIRELMDDYLAYQPWGDWIIDIGLGMQIDKVASGYEYMFLPDYIFAGFEGATLRRDSVTVPLVSESINVFTPDPEEPSMGFFTPFNFFVIMFFVVGFITNRDFKQEKRTKWIDPIVFSLAGLLGWWLIFLWAGTEHLSKENINLLWAIPFHIPLIFLLGIKRFQKFLGAYFMVTSAWYLLLLILWTAFPQPLHQALIPYVLTMVLRGFYIYFDLQKQLRKRNISDRLPQN